MLGTEPRNHMWTTAGAEITGFESLVVKSVPPGLDKSGVTLRGSGNTLAVPAFREVKVLSLPTRLATLPCSFGARELFLGI